MIRLSSSLTLGLAIFVPVFWFVFFGSLTLFIVLADPEDLPITNSLYFKMGFSGIFITFAGIIYKTLFQLKRVELDEETLYVTNYFKTIAFDIKAISTVRSKTIFNFVLVRLHLKHKTSFGSTICFLSDHNKFHWLMDRLHKDPPKRD
jgi:uncharacterized integral membrane protein